MSRNLFDAEEKARTVAGSECSAIAIIISSGRYSSEQMVDAISNWSRRLHCQIDRLELCSWFLDVDDGGDFGKIN